jgi:hypothetical protein
MMNPESMIPRRIGNGCSRQTSLLSSLRKFSRRRERRRLLSDEHFTVDGPMIEANASLKSFRKKDGGNPPDGSGSNPEVNFRGEKRKNDTHESTTDPESKLYRKGDGQPAQLCYLGHVRGEFHIGLVKTE